ncbi:MAG: hypothetical protein ACRDQ5_18440 [Sciscionella sp.]
MDLVLDADVVKRLDSAGEIELGFPQDFITGAGEFVYGTVGERVVPRD